MQLAHEEDEKGTQQTQFKVTIEEGKATIPIKLRPQSDKALDDWNEKIKTHNSESLLLHLEASAQGEEEQHTETSEGFQVRKGHEIIFPLLAKPENDKGTAWGVKRNWSAGYGTNVTTFGSGRTGGRRKHTGRNLYTNPYEPVVSMCHGEVLYVGPFYGYTDEVTILHKTSKGETFVIRYGELDPKSINVKKGDYVKQGQALGKTGFLRRKNDTPIVSIEGTTVYMLHLEYYSGDSSLSINSSSTALTQRGIPPFKRRSDLKDPLGVLEKAYYNTFD